MKTIIAGSRSCDDYNEVVNAVFNSKFHPTEIISGTARGADRLGERYAQEFEIPLKKFPANWERYGKAAGRIRNAEMADYAEALIALWDGISPGTGNMIDVARKRNLRVYIHLLK